MEADPIRFVPAIATATGLLLALVTVLAASGTGRAALQRPLYTAGDRWVYVLQGTLGGLPGMNASENGTFALDLSGIAEVDVVGAASSPAGGVRVETHSSGVLNGTFALTANQTIHVSGTFSSDAAETWEGTDYLPVASNTSSGYVVNVKTVITVPFSAFLWVNATTAYGSLPPYNLSVGESAVAPFSSDLAVATSFSAVVFKQHMENRTSLAGFWERQVLAQETVGVEAGTFPAYRLNQTLGAFPGIGAFAASGAANETAWFSNDVGNYVRRVAYVNGTPVGEMRLKSYTYPAPPEGLPLAEVALFAAAPILFIAVLLTLLARRRRKAREAPKGSSGAGPVGELPPKRGGGSP